MFCCGGGHHGHGGGEQPGHPAHPVEPPRTGEDPLVILKRRLAHGEITVEEYEKLQAILQR